ncbi:MAG: ABC transporter substrate-binding protein [Actinomycetota bacterium]
MLTTHRRSSARAAALTLAVALVAACGGSDDDDGADTTAASAATTTPATASATTEPSPTTGAPTTEAAPATTDTAPETTPDTTEAPVDEAIDSPVDLGRVVVIGEEFLLADFLALGGQAVAATATLGDEFVGIERDTTGIDPLSSTDPNFELLASYDPDLIITTTGVVDLVGTSEFEAIAETAVVDNTDWQQQVRDLAAAMGVPERADQLLAQYDEAIAAAEVPAGLEASAATVYSGENVAAWVDGPVNIPQVLLDLGLTLTPGGGELDGESNGRVFLSNELIPVLDGEVLILAQTSGVEGEDESLANVSAQPLWQQLPAVAAGNVVTIDRLGYPGVEGRIRIINDVLSALPQR